MSYFEKQTSFQVEYAPAHITKWRSSRTGLQLTYIDQPSPIVNGYFAVATEIPDNSGCPHTLEHLIFMGSKKFPYKGLLDNLGNRFFSSTNAWTSVDQTVYTLTTAGWEGFKTLLPIYLDHLFFPTLTDEACLTEVYHIDGKGKEKGVVFSEMQGIENQSWFISYLNMQETLYAKDSGYSSETGGLMSELRHLTNDQIKAFHKSMYRPDNLCVIITGSVNEEELLHTMSEFDAQLEGLPDKPNKRPFVDSKEDVPLKSTIIKEIEFPDADESMGELIISWIGPKATDTITNVALDIVGSYFTDSPISLLNKLLVEIESPLATDIDYGTDDYLRTTVNFNINGVPTEKLKEVDTKVKEIILSQTDPKTFNLPYMRQVLNQQKLKFVFNTEKSSSLFSNISISEFIYGKLDGSNLNEWCRDLREFDILMEWTADQWCLLIKEQLVDNKSASILARPSIKLNNLQTKHNRQIIKDIKSKYGKPGLAKLEEQLKNAQAKNDAPIPDSVLTQFGKPDPAKIDFIKTESYKAGSNNINVDYINDDKFSLILEGDTPAGFPMPFHFENYKSQFTTINLVMSSVEIDEDLLPYMSIIEEIFSMSIKLPNGTYIPYDEVISHINDDLIEFQLDNGFESQFLELITIKVKFESKKYFKAIEWLLNVMKYSIFEEQRIKVIVEKIINSLPDKKRNGELMMYSLQYRTLFKNRSLRKAQDSIHTEEFYKALLQNIEDGNFLLISNDLNRLRKQLFNLKNFKTFVIGDVQSLQNPVSSWSSLVKELDDGNSASSPRDFGAIPHSSEFLSDMGRKCSNSAFIVTIPATESSHLISSTRIPTNYLDKDIFKIALASEFLTAVEGPFWRGIRGTGLAYGASISRNPETGYLSFIIYRGADPDQAWLTAKEIVGKYADRSLAIDQISIENAIAAIVNQLANSESNNYEAANSKISDNVFKKRGPNYVKRFLSEINLLQESDIIYALNRYFKPLFEAQSSVLFCCVSPSKSNSIKEFWEQKGYQVLTEVINSSIVEDGSDISTEEGSEDDSEDSDENSDGCSEDNEDSD